MPDGSGMDSFADLTHTPQGDGSQLNADPVGLVVAANQLTPRKGTENFSEYYREENQVDLTHTPQGDDNSSILSSSSSVTGINSHPARGRKPIPVDKDDNQAFGFNSHPARGHNRRAFSALHNCGRKGSFAFLKFLCCFSNRARRQSLSLSVRQKHLKRKGQSL